MEDAHPVLATPTSRAGEARNYSSPSPRILNQATENLLSAMRYYYLVLNYIKMRSHKKKQTTQIHESHLLLVNSSGSQVLGFIIFPDIREPRQG